MIKPFDTIAVTYGEPVFLDADEPEAAAVARIESALAAVSASLPGDPRPPAAAAC